MLCFMVCWVDIVYGCICIFTGKPSPLYKDDDIDWAPSLHLGHNKKFPTATPERGERRRARKRFLEADSGADAYVKKPASIQHAQEEAPAAKSGTSTQTYLDGNFLSSMEGELQRLMYENAILKKPGFVKPAGMGDQAMFKDDDENVRLFTGLPSYVVLMVLFNYIEPFLPQAHNSALSKFQQLILVLMRLKLNLPGLYLAHKFKISSATVSKIFTNTLHVLFIRLQPLIYWPEKEELRKTMPIEFRKYFGLNVSVITDCFELFIERPSNLMARAQTWSSYKHHNTVKYLIGIAPQGAITFISNGYGGRASDKFITNDCGLLDRIKHGDIVLADRGFDIAESIAQAGGELKIPAFTRGKTQLSASDVQQTRKIAHVRIHVKRVIGLIRNKYKFLQDVIPLNYLQSQDDSVPTIDKIVTVCCALVNMCKSVVPFN